MPILKTQKAPVILAYYAQSEDNTHLAYLRKEYVQNYEQWKKTDTDGSPIDLKYLFNPGDAVSAEDIRKDIIAYKERVLIFHFSGHTDGEAIFLSSGTGRAEGLAGLLAQNARNLKLVFLNGCANEAQVEVLFAHNIPVVIATQCAVGDRIATEFSRCFYESLATHGNSIQYAYTAALYAIGFDGRVAGSLPKSVRNEDKAEVYEADRSGNLPAIKLTTNIWKLYVRKGDEWVVDDADWWRLPGRDEKPKGVISLEKAYTCDRVANTQVFQQFFEFHGRSKSVQHYLVVDEPELSPHGLSFKLVYEHITRQKLLNRFSYQCDPNETSYEDGFVVLSRYDDVARIANRVYVSLLDEFTKKREWDRFEDFYAPNVVKDRDYVIVFIQIDEAELSGVAGAVREFMTQSTAYAATHPPAHSEKRAKLLFFWHIVVDIAPEVTGLTSWWRGLFGRAKTPDKRQVCVEQFGSLYKTKDPAASTLWVVNENVRPLPIPQEEHIKDWLVKNKFLDDPHLTNPTDFDNDVRVLENKFRNLIEHRRIEEATSRLRTN